MDFFVNGGNVFPVRSAFFTEHSGVPERVNVGVRKRGMTLIAAPCSFIFIYSSRSYYPACTNLFIGFTKPLSSLFKTFVRFCRTIIQSAQNFSSVSQNHYPVCSKPFFRFCRTIIQSAHNFSSVSQNHYPVCSKPLFDLSDGFRWIL